MSHYSVYVRVPACDAASIDSAIASMLLPFKESGFGDRDPPELSQYLTFHDTEDDSRNDYATGSRKVFVSPTGEVASKYEYRFRRDAFSRDYVAPAGWQEREQSFAEAFATFDEYVARWLEEERDQKTGRLGYWQNPNKKWDWYQVGGRYEGELPLRGGAKAAKARVCQVDFDAIFADARQRHGEFVAAYKRRVSGETGKFWDDFIGGQRRRALSLGLLTYGDVGDVVRDEAVIVEQWSNDESRCDVIRIVDDMKLASLWGAFLPWYAALDAVNGWRAPGEMGWFGYSSDTDGEASSALGARIFADLREGNELDWLVVVDCHI